MIQVIQTKVTLQMAQTKTSGEKSDNLHKNLQQILAADEGDTPLHEAVKLRNLYTVQALLEHSPDVNLRNRKDYTPLHIAAAIGRLDIAEILLNHGGEVNQNAGTSRTTVYSVIKFAGMHIQLGREEGENIDLGDCGQKPLHMAAEYGHTEVMRLLLARGANMNAKDQFGNNPLHLAAGSGNVKAVEILLKYSNSEHGTNQQTLGDNGEPNEEYTSLIRSKDSRGWTQLQVAIIHRHPDVVDHLLKLNKHLGLLDATDCNVLHTAIDDLRTNQSNNSERVIEILLTSNLFDINSMGASDARTPLHHIIQEPALKGRRPSRDDRPTEAELRVFQMLLDRGTNVNQTSPCGKTALMLAAENGYDCSIQRLLDFGRKKGNPLLLDQKDRNGRTALMLAVAGCHQRVVKLLVNNGASINVCDNFGFTPLSAAFTDRRMFWEDLEYLCSGCLRQKFEPCDQDGSSTGKLSAFESFKRKLKVHYKYVANYKQEKEKILNIVSNCDEHNRSNGNDDAFRKCQPHEIDGFGRTPLHRVVISLLLKIDVEFPKGQSANGQEGWGKARPHLSIGQHQAFAVFPTTTHNSESSAHFSTICDNSYNSKSSSEINIEKMLELPIENIKKLAQVTDYKGRTAFHYAVMLHDDRPVIYDRSNDYYSNWVQKVFPNFGVDVNATDIYGRTPLHYAKDCEVYFFLQERGASEEVTDVRGHTPKFLKELRSKMELLKYEKKLSREVWPSHICLGDVMKLNCRLNHINKKLECFVERVASAISEKDYRFTCRSTLVGSASDGTKLIMPGDFDFDLTLTEISKRCEVSMSPEIPSGYVQLKRKTFRSEDSDFKSEDDFDELFNDDQLLLVGKVNFRFKIILQQILCDPNFWRDDDTFEFYGSFDFETINNSYTISDSLHRKVELSMVHPIQDEYGDLYFTDLSMDLVPSISLDNWQPEDVPDYAKNKVKDLRFSVVFDLPQRFYPWVTFVETYARISFANAESQIIKNSSHLLKAAYLVAKSAASSGIKSFHMNNDEYVLKTCFLYCIEALDLPRSVQQIDEQFENLTPEEIYPLVQNILFCFAVFCDQDFAPCYFMPSFALPIHEHLKSFHMESFLRTGRRERFASLAHELYTKLFPESPDPSITKLGSSLTEPLREFFNRDEFLKNVKEKKMTKNKNKWKVILVMVTILLMIMIIVLVGMMGDVNKFLRKELVKHYYKYYNDFHWH